MTEVIYYYVNDSKFYCVDDNTDFVYTLTNKQFSSSPAHKFRLLDGYDKTPEDLIKYKCDFNIWEQEIRKVKLFTKDKKEYRLKIKDSYTLTDTMIYMLNRKDMLNKFEQILKEEALILERCLTSGLITFDRDYKEKIIDVFGHDFSGYYSKLLQNMKIPIKAGKKHNLESVVYGKLKFGIYRVYVECSNKEFHKIFNFSPNHHYTHSALNWIHTIKDKFNIELKLLDIDEDIDYNAYIYNYEDLIDGEDIFEEYYNKIDILVKKCSKSNKLVKMFKSGLWGHLITNTKEYINDEKLSQIDALDKSDIGDGDCDYMIKKHYLNYKIN